ncbi:MAG: c-type cytochrome [Flavobacteriales bacterium]|nr:c-type cytochrome [Flavobacteriales bacterium]
MKKYLIPLILVLFSSCQKDETVGGSFFYDESEEYPGGEKNTVFDFSPNAFGHVSPAITGLQELNFFVGNSFFNQNWVSAPASTTARDGLGPTFNARSCSACHFKDGRGRPPAFNGENATGFLMRLSIAGTDQNGAPSPHPSYGGQFNPQSNIGILSEGEVYINYVNTNYTFPDGESYSLQMPFYSFFNLNFGSISGVLTSPRVGQQMIGLGLLESIYEADILVNVDEQDVNNDGVSGKANYVYDVATGTSKLGRFGWKAGQPNLRQQTAGAFLGDIGITTTLFPLENCTSPQNDCLNAVNGGIPELPDSSLDLVELYVSNLAVPARRNINSYNVKQGKKLFNDLGCIACHKANYTTGINFKFSNLSNQKIWPYTDLLLHDMGVGLADNRPEFLANGQEWRTAPLWGVGLIETVNNHTLYLHDGRARNLIEAIMWHGGEAGNAKNNFTTLSKVERDQLIEFVKSL